MRNEYTLGSDLDIVLHLGVSRADAESLAQDLRGPGYATCCLVL